MIVGSSLGIGITGTLGFLLGSPGMLRSAVNWPTLAVVTLVMLSDAQLSLDFASTYFSILGDAGEKWATFPRLAADEEKSPTALCTYLLSSRPSSDSPISLKATNPGWQRHQY